MPNRKSPQDLSVDELHRLLVEKNRAARQERLDRYRRTGRVVRVASDLDGPAFEGWRTSPIEDEPAEAKRGRGRRVLDFFLLLVELSAVAGFLWIVFSGLQMLQELNREAIAAIEQPTLTPTPLIQAVVLPSGHTPPDSPGGTQFNEAEIPEHLRPLVQSLFNAPAPTPSPEQARFLPSTWMLR